MTRRPIRLERNKIEKIMVERGAYTLGMRGLYKNEGIGPLRRSRIWSDGNATFKSLRGTSVILVGDRDDPNWDFETALKRASIYGDGKVGLVVGNAIPSEIYEDPHEVVLKDAYCIAIVK